MLLELSPLFGDLVKTYYGEALLFSKKETEGEKVLPAELGILQTKFGDLW